MGSTEDEIEDELEKLMRPEHWESAIALIEQVAAERRSARLNWSHGWALFKLDRFFAAAQSLRRAVLQEVTNPVNHWALGVVLTECGDLHGAEHHLWKALSIKDSGLARLNLAIVYMNQRRFADAERVHLDGIDLKPNSRKRLEAYADFLDDRGRETEAAAIRDQAKTLPAKSPRQDLL